MRTSHGHIAQVYNPGTTDGWKKMVWAYAMQNRPDKTYPISQVQVWMVFHFSRPRHHFGTGSKAQVLKEGAATFHTIRPDLDNLAKPVLDALTDSGVFWEDDSAVYELHLGKRYSADPGVHITISSAQP